MELFLLSLIRGLLFICLTSAAHGAATPSQSVLMPSLGVAMEASPEWCPTCVSFIEQTIDELLNLIANGGVLATCGSLCNLLPTQLEAIVCNLFCDYVGIQVFVKLVQIVDPDSIYICKELSVCPISTNSSASFKFLSVLPTSEPQGTTFELKALYVVYATIGTGELTVEVLPPSGLSIDGSMLLVSFEPGTYPVSFSVSTEPSEDEPFLPVQSTLCEGLCGSSHPYSKTLAKATTQFAITVATSNDNCS